MTLLSPLDWPSAGIGPGPDVPTERRVTRDNWRLYPFSRWAFQHTRELVPSRAISPGPAPRALSAMPVDLRSLRFDDGEGNRIGWDDFLQRTYTDALLVLHRGNVAYEYYANGMTAAKPHMLFSITKSIVGLVAERLIGAGMVDPGVRVADSLPALAGTGFAKATLRHLLDMTDGAEFDENYDDPQGEVHLYSAAYWRPERGLGGVAAALPKLTRSSAAPGTDFLYRTPVADVAGLMLRQLTGQPLAKLVEDIIWRPAGCGDEAYMLLDTAGAEIAGTGLNATMQDLARLALWLQEPAQANLLTALLAGGDRQLFANSRYGDRSAGSYRSFWWIGHDPQPSIAALGVFGQRLYIEPKAQLALIRVGSHPVASNLYTDAIHRNAIIALRACLSA